MKSRLIHALKSPVTITLAAVLLRLCLLFAGARYSPRPVEGALRIGLEEGQVARSIAEGHGFSSPLGIETGPTAWFAPVYPYLMAGIFKLYGTHSLGSLVILQAIGGVFSGLTCLPIFFLGRHLDGEWLGVAGAWCWVFFRNAVYLPIGFVWDTSLTTLLCATIIAATYGVSRSKNVRWWAIYGALWATALLTNASLVVLLPFLLGWAVLQLSGPWRRKLQFGTAALLVLFAGISPWLARNAIVFGKPFLLRSNLGLELWLGNSPGVPDSFAAWLHPTDNATEREKYRTMGEMAYMAEKRRIALQFIRDNPDVFARFVLHRFAATWTGTTDPILDEWRTASADRKFVLVFNCAYSLLGFAGLWIAVRLWGSRSIPLASAMLVYPVIYYVTHTNPRYRHPIDPALTMLAVLAVATALGSLRRFAARRETAADIAPSAAKDLATR